jgi:hypothetical protein
MCSQLFPFLIGAWTAIIMAVLCLGCCLIHRKLRERK